MQDTVKFPVDTKGQESGQEYKGLFTAKTKLSMREMLREDEIRRGLLGDNPNGASDIAKVMAAALAYLAVRIVDAPQWWKDANGGQDLQDENVLVAVHNGCADAIGKLYDAQVEEAEKAREDLKKQKADEVE